MQIKSYFVVFVLLFLSILALVLSLRRCHVLDIKTPFAASEQSAEPGIRMAEAEAVDSMHGDSPDVSEQSQQSEPLPTATAPSPSERIGIEGLTLRLSRPLMFEIHGTPGLAATSEFFFVSSVSGESGHCVLTRVDRRSYGVDVQRSLEQYGQVDVGGMQLGPDGLWLALRSAGEVPSSVVLALAPESLELLHAFGVEDRIRAVAQDDQGRVFGINEPGTFFYEWDVAGNQIRRRPNAASAQYVDMEIVRGSLVCAGQRRQEWGGVIDIVDPETFTILARHASYARSLAGYSVTGGGFAYAGGVFFLLPDPGDKPMLMSYVLEDVALQDFVPSVR